MKRRFSLITVLTILIMAACGVALAADSASEFNNWPPPPATIAGKPYSITKGEDPGTFIVKWGDEHMIWKPKDYMEPKYKEMGPAFYSIWTQKGMPLPFNVPLDQRDKLSGTQFLELCDGTYEYEPYATNYFDQVVIKNYRPDGSLRGSTDMLEMYTDNSLGNGAQYFNSSEKDTVLRKYLWEYINPPEVRGEGGVTTTFKDLSLPPQDTLYLPTVRKVRRLAGAVSKQYFPGLIYRYEDVSHTNPLPELNYKVIGFELFNPTPEMSISYRSDHEPNVKRFDGAGDVAVKVEITPKPGVSWWYSKRIFYCGLQEMGYIYDYAVDSNGKLIRKYGKPAMGGELLHMHTPDGPLAPNWYVAWGMATVENLDSGYQSDAWIVRGGFNASIPDSMFTDTTLYRQPKSLLEWLQ